MSKGGKSKGPGKAPDPKGTRGDDILNGNDRDNRIDGGKGDDQIFGNGGNDWLRGGKGEDHLLGGSGSDLLQGGKDDDFLEGGDGNDILFGNEGRDALLGGAGNDLLFGDDKSHGHGFGHRHDHGHGKHGHDHGPGYFDFLDGGAGSDRAYGGKGDDIFNYTMSENLTSCDFYDGGRGFDTLFLTLTYGEFAQASVQEDIARFQAFIAENGNPLKDKGRTFDFESFGLDAKNFEALAWRLVNTGPTAAADNGATDEDTPLIVPAAAGLFANDSDPDHLDVISLVGFDAASVFGATVMVGADGSYSYDPTSVPGFQSLQVGESVFDSFTYTIRDLAGATSTATVTIEVVGANDAPVANDDGPFVIRPTQTLALSGADLVANDFDPDGDALSVSNFQATSAQGGSIANPAFDQFLYTPPALFRGIDTFVITVADGFGGFAESTVTVEVVNSAPDTTDDGPFVIRPGQALNLVGADLTANDTDADGDALTVSNYQATSVQGGVITNPGFDQFVYLPPSDYIGADSFIVTVTDDFGGFTESTVFVEIVNTAPDTTDDGPYVVRPGQTLSLIGGDLVANDTDADGDALSVSNFFSTSTEGGTIENPGFDVFIYTPPADFTGTDSFGVVVADGYGGFTESTVIINVVNTAPDTTDDGPFNIRPGQTLALIGSDLVANDSDADGDALSVSNYFSTSAQGGSVSNPSFDQFVYTPPADFTGTDSFGIVVADGFGGFTGSTVTINVVNTAPDTTDDGVFSIRPGQTLALIGADLVANDTDADGDALSVSNFFSTSAEGGTIENPSFDQFVYTPPADFTGTDSFGVVVADGYGGFTESTVTINVVNTAPDTTDDGPFVVTAGDTLTLIGATLIANDSDADGDVLSVSNYFSTSAQGGSISNPSFGQFVYTPPTGFTGTDSFDIVVTDDFGGFTSSTVTINVVADDPPPPPPPQGSNAVLPSVSPAAADALSYYIHFEGISGQSWLELGSFSFGMEAIGGTHSGGGGGGAGKVQVTDVYSALGSGATTTALLNAIGSGKILSDVEIEVYRGGLETKDQLLAEYKFSEVVLTGLDSHGGDGLANDVSFAYSGFGQRFIGFDSKTGQQSGETTTSWSLAQNNSGGSALLPQGGPQAAARPPEAQVGDNAQLEYFVRFDGVSGWLELEGYSFGIDNNSSTVTGGGAGAGISTADGVTLSLGGSAALTSLTGSLLAGKHLENVEIEVYRTGLETKDVLIEEFRFTDVTLSGLWSQDAAGNLLTFEYDQITHAHRTVDSKGAATTTNAGWDFAANEPEPVPGAVADAVNVQPLPSVPSGADLDYYIHFEGVNGQSWLQLESFSFGMEATGGTHSGGGGGGAGKVQVSDLVSALGSSATTTALLGAIGAGKILNDVEIEVYRPGDSKDQLLAEYKFSGVVLTGLANLGTGEQIGTDVSFDYLGFGQRQISFDSKTGQPTGEAVASWDFINNTAGSGALLPQSGAQATAQPAESQATGPNLEVFVRFDGVNGWLELDNFSLDINSSLDLGSGGAQIGKATAGDVALSLGASAALTSLTGSLLAGKQLANVEIEVYRSGLETKDALIDEFRFTDVILSGLQSNDATGNLLTFQYDQITHAHRTVDSKGAATTTTAGWDFVAGEAEPVPAATAEAITAVPVVSTPSGADLDYYIRFEGISGQEWLELGSFGYYLSHTGGGLAGSGGGAGKVSASDVYSELGSSATGTRLLAALGAGELIDSVEIEVYRSGLEAKDQLLAEYKFSNAVLTGLDSYGAGTIGNNLTFDFTGFGQRQISFDSKTGNPAGETTASWDFWTNTPGSGALLPQSGGQAVSSMTEPQVTDGSQLDYYVRFDGVDGWLQTDAFQFDVANSTNLQVQGGAGAGISTANGASMMLGASAALPGLTGSLFAGKHLEEVEIEVYHSGAGKAVLIDEFRFEDVTISGLDSANAVSNLLSFDFERVSHAHRDMDGKGQLNSFTSSGWDFAQNMEFSGPNPTPDVDII